MPYNYYEYRISFNILYSLLVLVIFFISRPKNKSFYSQKFAKMLKSETVDPLWILVYLILIYLNGQQRINFVNKRHIS